MDFMGGREMVETVERDKVNYLYQWITGHIV